MARILMGIGIVALDCVILFVPLGSIFLAYVIISRPAWFIKFLQGR
jgi:hypothetical protein